MIIKIVCSLLLILLRKEKNTFYIYIFIIYIYIYIYIMLISYLFNLFLNYGKRTRLKSDD